MLACFLDIDGILVWAGDPLGFFLLLKKLSRYAKKRLKNYMENSIGLLSKDMNNQVLKTLVGSHAHGLNTPTSDFDFRGVFIMPTEDFFRLPKVKIKTTDWVEDDVDNVSWELGHFLDLATHCNPSVLEVFLSPRVDKQTKDYDDGDRLRDLFPFVWNSKGVMESFIGYGLNQRKKYLEGKDGRPAKFAAAYIRSLYNGLELLKTGTFTVKIADLPIGATVRRFKAGEASVGEVIQTCHDLEIQVRKAYEDNPDKKTEIEPINDFLIEMRRKHFDV